MIHFCLLAAGSGKRFGANKLLADFQGKPLWRYGFETLQKAANDCGGKLHVITRYPEIAKEAGEFALLSPESEKGISFSIKAACLSCLPLGANDKLLFCVADQPFLSVKTVLKTAETALATSIEEEMPLAACAFDGERCGNPVVFSACLLKDLMQLEGDRGGKTVLKNYPGRTEKVICNKKELLDIDFQDDVNLK